MVTIVGAAAILATIVALGVMVERHRCRADRGRSARSIILLEGLAVGLV